MAVIAYGLNLKGTKMENYRAYLPELKTTTLFQDIEDEALRPRIIRKKIGDEIGPWDMDYFKVILKTYPAQELQPRRFKWDMPKHGEPGMLMGEIPSLSRYLEPLGRTFDHKSKPLEKEMDLLEMSGEMMTKFYSPEIAVAQGVMLRNLLGILAQKVMDVRYDLFMLRDGRDVFAPAEPK